MSALRIVFAAATLSLISGSALADCKSDIQGYLKSMETSGPYRVEMSSVANGSTTNITVELALPHSMHMKGEGVEMLMTQNGVWMANGGSLQKMPDTMKDQMQGMIRQGMNMGVQAVDKVECLGSAEFQGGTFDLYKYEAKANFMGVDSFSKVDMYIDGSGKPAWLVVDGEAMGTKSVTTQKITFDDAITISDPQ
jgi:hypothetical protein